MAIPRLALLAAFGLAGCAGGGDGERETRRIDLGLEDSRQAGGEDGSATENGEPAGDESAEGAAGGDEEPVAEDPAGTAEPSAADPTARNDAGAPR